MGRKRWWNGGLELLVFCLFQSVIYGDGEIGCLFSKNVCRSGVETCYDDLAFGRCIPPFIDLDDEDVYRYDLDASELELLRKKLQRLVIGGYEWSHPYTQCVMQSSLYSLRYKMKSDMKFCLELAESTDQREFEPYEEIEESQQESQPLAVVNFTPTRGHGYGDFADERYYPPASSSASSSSLRDETNRRPLSDDDYNYVYSSFVKKPDYERPPKLEEIILNEANSPEVIFTKHNKMIDGQELPEYVEANMKPVSSNFREMGQALDYKYNEPMYRLRRQSYRDEQILRDFNRDSLKLDDYLESARDILRDSDREILKDERERNWNSGIDRFRWKFTKDGLISANETLPIIDNENSEDLEFLKNDHFKGENDGGNEMDRWNNDYTGDEKQEQAEEEEEIEVDNNDSDAGTDLFKDQRSNNKENNEIHNEGGLDISDAIRQVPDDIFIDDDLFMWSRDLASFQRNERLDVKKPGPLFSTNNYAFKTASAAPVDYDDRIVNDDEKNSDEMHRLPLVKKTLSSESLSQDISQTYENVDLDHVYIEFTSTFTNWEDGEKVVKEVAKLLGFDSDVFPDIRVGRAEVTFKVTDDVPYKAEEIALQIDNIRNKLEKKTGRIVTRAGVGDKVKLPPSVEVSAFPKVTMSTGVFGAIVAAGGAAAAAAAVVTLIIARKHAKTRAKLAGLATPDPEASKDYQELCRARMQAKQPNEKPESPRIINLSRESESNRSSTSSWGEEAAALTNMDISTGLMVLTYMEDHLKNKDRLDQEWSGICAYEAEPSSVAIATEKSNIDRNRPGSSLPYDHSRVVLNDLSNAFNSNYINASTITDHDPRNPAYIATQGPLPQTSADFWQLVWEQGSVVIVMLTRLTEEGRGMCHRYWPEEGSELYHIYEVHLVSEHIWCDDYLVRSFYLKNLRTGETRTVTQFHFLSWPENAVPHSIKALLEFRRKVNKSYRGRSCPIVVHCSDGAGRTGTYCLIDMVLNRMAKGAKEIDIAAALEHIRDQRPGMVATKQQFEFVLGAVAEEVHAILKALPVQSVSSEKSQLAVTSSTIVDQ